MQSYTCTGEHVLGMQCSCTLYTLRQLIFFPCEKMHVHVHVHVHVCVGVVALHCLLSLTGSTAHVHVYELYM